MLSSLQEADIEAFDMWYSSQSPSGYAFFSEAPQGEYKDLIEAIKIGGLSSWDQSLENIDSTSQNIPYWIEGLARFGMRPEQPSKQNPRS